MAKYPVGKLIASTRKKLRISQEDLSSGICSTPTLSKIENGVQMPSYKVCNAIMERLGLPKAADLYVSDRELERSNLERQITGMIAREEYDIADLLREYQNCRKEMNQLEQQFYTYSYGIMVKKKENNPQKALELYRQAIEISIPDFSMQQLRQTRLFTLDEITIINDIANVSYEMGDKKLAEKYMYFLKDYLENAVIDEEEKAKKYPVILYNLSNWLENDERYEEMIPLCRKGIDYCIEQGKLTVFPYLLFNMGYSLGKTGQYEESESYMKQAYYGFIAVRHTDIAETVKKEAYSLLHIEV